MYALLYNNLDLPSHNAAYTPQVQAGFGIGLHFPHRKAGVCTGASQ